MSLKQSHFTASLLLLTILKKIIFFWKPVGFFSKNQNLNVLRKLINSVAFYSKFATFITFLKNRIFFKKTMQLLKKNTFRKFRELLLFQWPCSVTLLLLAILKKSTIFSITQSVFFWKKNQFLWTFWEILLSRLLSASNWLLLAVLKKI